ncbi:merozoite capping protein [Babesia ovis]|uniref:thioredoxin-dependent peroxiredoxin n=1 Tax=Babesia ovis TaxID=5869 RepID=A0A9W5TDH5_BABOV|nr:merozoite capping protein [Babesia ovis]
MAGTTIPDDILDAKLSTDAKQETSLRSILSGLPPSYKGIVMFLFPAVNTPLCTRQACKFATSTKSFRDLGYEVYGLTGGAGDSAKGWVSKNNLNYTVLLDPQWNLINHLKCTWMYFMINRSHLIISRDAKILALERGVNAEKSAERVLEIIKSLRSTTE